MALALNLQDDLVHELASLLKLSKLLLKVDVEVAEMEHLLTVSHTLDASKQVVSHVVAGLECRGALGGTPRPIAGARGPVPDPLKARGV